MVSKHPVKRPTAKPADDATLPDEAGRLRRVWLHDNREAAASINRFIERHGLLSSKLRYRPTESQV